MNNETSLIYLEPESNYYNECLPDFDDSCCLRYMAIESYMNKTSISDTTILSYDICSFNASSHSFLPLLTDDRFTPKALLLTETWFEINSTEDINGYIAYYRKRSENRSGGVSVCVSKILALNLRMICAW